MTPACNLAGRGLVEGRARACEPCARRPEITMFFTYLTIAVSLVPVTGVVLGLLELSRGDLGRKAIARAFDTRAADVSRG